MSRNGKVIVAMSGGVDSSVAAALLKDQGYECVGVFLRVGVEHDDAQTCAVGEPRPQRRLRHGCCSASDSIDARVVAELLGIPFYALNFRDDFERIIDYFVDEYVAARTPNPCVMCNIHVKFGKLFEYADLMDAEFVATGHYARIIRRNDQPRLARAANLAKDQSYVLFGIERERLARCMFPLGEMTDKADVRRLAAALDLRTHDKPDSQEICFVPNNEYRDLIRARRPEALRPGPIVHADGEHLGEHDGLVNFTIGQRRGLGIAAGRPVYVTRLDVLQNTVVVGEAEDVLHRGLIADRINWLQDRPSQPRPCTAKIRHMHSPAPATLSLEPAPAVDAARIAFAVPQTAVTPGQAAVFYDADDAIIGGGWIRASIA